MRDNNRKNTDIRNVKVETNYTMYAEGSVLYCQGNTKVLCNASVEERVPPHVLGTGKGWVTAEYSMLPRATSTRNRRDVSSLKLSPRSTEIQRLVARSLRGAIDLSKLGERTITVDCDVIQADGGTRCASITGGYIALALAVKKLLSSGVITENPLTKQVAALSVGIVDDIPVCDLCYAEDSRAQTDMNVIMTSNGGFIEIQGTAEGKEFDKKELDVLLDLARNGMQKLFAKQALAINPELSDKYLIATNNKHKLTEFKRIFDTLGLELITPSELGIKLDPEENGASFADNAIIKAKAFAEATGLPTVADDSGLCVDALDGAPGIYSARYGGEKTDADRLDLLIENMKDKTNRIAHFTCAIACVIPDKTEFTAEGYVYGKIADKAYGNNGFGYDPVFVPDGFNKTFGELSGEQKDKISHRANALHAFSEKIKEYIDDNK